MPNLWSNTCKAEVSWERKSSKTFNTTNIANHLKMKHIDEYKSIKKKNAAEVDTSELQEPSRKQKLIQDWCGSLKKWGINSRVCRK